MDNLEYFIFKDPEMIALGGPDKAVPAVLVIQVTVARFQVVGMREVGVRPAVLVALVRDVQVAAATSEAGPETGIALDKVTGVIGHHLLFQAHRNQKSIHLLIIHPSVGIFLRVIPHVMRKSSNLLPELR